MSYFIEMCCLKYVVMCYIGIEKFIGIGVLMGGIEVIKDVIMYFLKNVFVIVIL